MPSRCQTVPSRRIPNASITVMGFRRSSIVPRRPVRSMRPVGDSILRLHPGCGFSSVIRTRKATQYRTQVLILARRRPIIEPESISSVRTARLAPPSPMRSVCSTLPHIGKHQLSFYLRRRPADKPSGVAGPSSKAERKLSTLALLEESRRRLYDQSYGTRQFQPNVVDTVNWAKGRHLFKAGADYRQTTTYMGFGFLSRGPYIVDTYKSAASTLANALDTVQVNTTVRQDPTFKNLRTLRPG